MATIEVEHISKAFGAQKAVKDVSFTVEPGEIFGLLGPNGAGKTTSIRIILDIFRPDSGKVSIFGGALSEAHKNRTGYMPEERGLYKTTDGGKSWNAVLTISENTGVSDLVMDPRDPDVLIAASHQRRRHVFTKIDGGPETALYRTTDGGATWEKLSSGLPGGDKGAIGLAVSPVNPDVVYAIIEAPSAGWLAAPVLGAAGASLVLAGLFLSAAFLAKPTAAGLFPVLALPALLPRRLDERGQHRRFERDRGADLAADLDALDRGDRDELGAQQVGLGLRERDRHPVDHDLQQAAAGAARLRIAAGRGGGLAGEALASAGGELIGRHLGDITTRSPPSPA